MSAGELAELKRLVATCVIRHREADIVLSSGRKSDFYFDGRKVSLSASGAALLGEILLDAFAGRVDAVGGLTLGADPIVGAVLAAAGRHSLQMLGFLARKEPKAHGTTRFVEGPELPAGCRAALVDDVATTGASFLKAQEALLAQYGEGRVRVVGCWCLVDREEGARAALAERGLQLHALFRKSDFALK